MGTVNQVLGTTVEIVRRNLHFPAHQERLEDRLGQEYPA